MGRANTCGGAQCSGVQFSDFALPEGAIRDFGMWDGQSLRRHDSIAKLHNIDVQHTRPPSFASHSTPPCFNSKTTLQKLLRRHRGFEENHLVEISVLVDWAEGLRLLHRTHRTNFGARQIGERLARECEVILSHAEIRSERYEDRFTWFHHACVR